jgi:PhnB protein
MSYSTPTITPYLLYEDLGAALDWLQRAFDFRLRHPVPTQNVTHAEMEFENAVIMMGHPGPQYRNPKHLGQVTQNLYVRVNDLDKHFARAVQAGAVILEHPTDQPYGDRRYGVEDPEGHRWYFAEAIARRSPLS